MQKNKFSNKFKYWADELIQSIDKEKHHRVDDMKTPSGHAHAGSLRAIATHGLVYEAMLDAGYDVEFTYVVNDIDPMDGLPVYLDKDVYEQHMGKPLYLIPAPDGKSENFAMQYANEYIAAFNKLNFKPKIFRSSELYSTGQINKWIIQALDNVETIRSIYLEVAGQSKPLNWYPFQVICPNCQKVGSSLVTDWDGKEVTFECKKDLVKWSTGCGYKGKISPLNGTGKLMWKVDWAAHWSALNITVEGAGKDHFSQGGSRFVSSEIMEQVFKKETPFGFLHEFLLIGGAKMSSSKGNAMTSHDFSQVLPQTIGRFLFIRTNYQRAINFDPNEQDTIPDLFDEYDNCANAWFESGAEGKFGRMYEAAQTHRPVSREKLYVPRFRYVVSCLVAKEKDIKSIIETQKGSTLTKKECELLDERIKFARIWLEKFAGDEKLHAILQETPSEVSKLEESQINFLSNVGQLLTDRKFESPEELQLEIYNISKKQQLPGKKAFEALYTALTGKAHGPSAGKLIMDALDENKELIISRLRDIKAPNANKAVLSKPTIEYEVSKLNGIDAQIIKDFGGISYAYTIIENVEITKSIPELEILKEQVVTSTVENGKDFVDNSIPINAYKAIFKKTGVDWRSKAPSPLALLKRVISGKGIYTVNTAVDAYNLAVLETGVGLGGFDLDMLKEPITLRYSKTGEKMHLLGDSDETTLDEGKVIYADNNGPITLNLNYRDIDKTKITEHTKNIILIADGAPGVDKKAVLEALQLGASYITRFCKGTQGKVFLAE